MKVRINKLKTELLSIEENFNRNDHTQASAQIEKLFDIMIESFNIKMNLSTKLGFRTDRDFTRFADVTELNKMSEAIHMNCICEIDSNLDVLKLAQTHAIEYAKVTGNLSHFGEYITSVEIAEPVKILKFLLPYKEHILASKIIAHVLQNNEALAKFASFS